ncbi:hypothetical protein JQ604_30820 [Bradyrhizobium jicamae]|uniref:hypothetical protein n=1 Tax=Bradyrhizobium jicamae TaxID=280332 RepID=UPI001BAE274F|nr:hypothetical protein [Bradyrhizobium jicamae]MBR0756592.1 hypothetical protein [Bradyrhizobium jicamae]
MDGHLEAYDARAGVKAATISVSSEWTWQCRSDGQQFVYLSMGNMTRIDIQSGDSRLLASFEAQEPQRTVLSLSPDFRSVATTVPLKFMTEADRLKVILVGQEKLKATGEHVQWIGWSGDGSRILVGYPSSLEILDGSGAKISSGARPKAEVLHDAWFDDRQESVILHMGPEQQRQGMIFRCHAVPWKCDRVHSRVESVSVSGQGIVGTVEPLGKTIVPDDDSIIFYPRYAAVIRNPASTSLVRQVYTTTREHWGFELSISPSGNWAILHWRDEHQPGCGTGLQSRNCAQGILVDISKAFK